MDIVRRGRDIKRAGLTLTWAVKNQEFPMRSEESQPHTTLPSLKHQCQEEEPKKHLPVKSVEVSTHMGQTEGCYKPRHPLTGLTHRFTCSQALILDSGQRTAAWEMPETYR